MIHHVLVRENKIYFHGSFSVAGCLITTGYPKKWILKIISLGYSFSSCSSASHSSDGKRATRGKCAENLQHTALWLQKCFQSLVKVSENFPVLEYTSSLDKRISLGRTVSRGAQSNWPNKRSLFDLFETLQVIIPLDVRFPLPSRARMHRMHI